MSKVFYHFLNWYSLNFRFPRRGLKYLIQFLDFSKLLDKRYIRKDIYGILYSLNLKDHIQRTVYWYGSYEKKEQDVLRKLLTSNSVFFDIGANIGIYSLLASKVISNHENIHSFEPYPVSFKQFLNNLSLNSVNNMRLNPVAVSDVSGDADLFISKEDNIGMTGLKVPGNFSGKRERVKTIRIDDYVEQNKISRIDVIKMDIEGNELMALQGMVEAIKKFSPVLMIEINKENLLRYNLKPYHIYEFLSTFNYIPLKIKNQKELLMIADYETVDDLIIFFPSTKKVPNEFSVNI